MPGDVFGLVAADIDRLRRMLAAYERGELGGRPGQSEDDRIIEGPSESISGFLTSAVTGLADLDSAPTYGTLNVYTYTTTGSVDTGRDERVWHFATVDATTDRWTFAALDRQNGKYTIYYQACSTT